MPRLDRRRVAYEAEVRELGAQVLDLRMQGRSRQDIAEILGISLISVHRHIKEQISAIRLQNETLAEEMFILHQDRLEHLFALVTKAINEAEGFDDKLFKTAISILERQAKLLGIDTTRSPGQKADPKGWLDDATPHELIAEVESYGISVDERFKLPKTVADIRRARDDVRNVDPDTAVGTASGPEGGD